MTSQEQNEAPQQEPREEAGKGKPAAPPRGRQSGGDAPPADDEAREDAEEIRRKAPTGLPGAAGGGLIGG